MPETMQQLTLISKVVVYVASDLAFQAMEVGRECMSPHHCLHCKKGEE